MKLVPVKYSTIHRERNLLKLLPSVLGSKEEWNGKEVASKEIKGEQRKTDGWKIKQTKTSRQANKQKTWKINWNREEKEQEVKHMLKNRKYWLTRK